MPRGSVHSSFGLLSYSAPLSCVPISQTSVLIIMTSQHHYLLVLQYQPTLQCVQYTPRCWLWHSGPFFCLLPFCLCQWCLSLIFWFWAWWKTALKGLGRFLPLDLSILSGKNSCSQSSCSDRPRWIGKHWALTLLSSPTLFTSMLGNSLLNESHFPWLFPSQDQCHHMARGDIHLDISFVSSHSIMCCLDTKLYSGMIDIFSPITDFFIGAWGERTSFLGPFHLGHNVWWHQHWYHSVLVPALPPFLGKASVTDIASFLGSLDSRLIPQGRKRVADTARDMHLVSSMTGGLSSATPDKETEATYCLMDTQVFFPFRQAGYLTDRLTRSLLEVPIYFQVHSILQFQPYLKELRSLFLGKKRKSSCDIICFPPC